MLHFAAKRVQNIFFNPVTSTF